MTCSKFLLKSNPSLCASTRHCPMGCLSSKPNVAPDPNPPAAPSAPSRPVTVATPTPPAPATPLASEHSSSTIHRTPSRSRKTSTHSTHRGEGSDLTRRDRRKSAPEQPPLPLQALPSQDRNRIRAQTFVTPGKGSHSVPRLPNPGEDDAWFGLALNNPPYQANQRGPGHLLQRCVKYFLIIASMWPHSGITSPRLIPRRFRILVLGKVHSCSTQLNSGRIETP